MWSIVTTQSMETRRSTIYRGSQNPNEEKPRISWSLLRKVAMNFGPAHMFQATILK